MPGAVLHTALSRFIFYHIRCFSPTRSEQQKVTRNRLRSANLVGDIGAKALSQILPHLPKLKILGLSYGERKQCNLSERVDLLRETGWTRGSAAISGDFQ